MNDNYNQDHKPTEVTYYPVEDYITPPKKKHMAGKIFGFVICAAVISMGSIGAYAAIAGTDPNYSVAGSGQVSNTENTVTTDMADENANKNLLQLSARENALSVPDIVKKVTPSVVGISSTMQNGNATGTGIIMSVDGYIITNAHVVQNAAEIKVTLNDDDNSEYSAMLIGIDEKTDLAVIKIQQTGLTAAEFGSSDELMVGELAIAIGNPLGLELSASVTGGMISALNREITVGDKTMTLIQTDAAINPGNSGGPLVNSYGQVIGINSAKISSSEVEGLGFAIPINSTIPIVDDLINNGYVTGRPLIGFSGTTMTAALAEYLGVPTGVCVKFMDNDSGAARGGVKVGDIITAINGTKVETMDELNAVKDKCKPNDTVKLSVFRNGEELTLDVVLTEAKQ